MKTLLYTAFNRIELIEQPRPRTNPDEVLLRVAACGLCGSELESFKKRSPRRTPPLVLGHEFCGFVEELGSNVSGLALGQPVVSNSLVHCDECPRCRRGQTHLCGKREVFGMHRPGAFAEYVAVPARCLVDWPAQLQPEAACLAEPLANGVHVVNLAKYLSPQTVLVIGAGPIGFMCQQAIQKMLCAQVIVADLSEERLSIAQRLGALHTVNVREQDLVAFVLANTQNEGVDLVVDAVGATATKQQSLAAMRPGGLAVWIGLHEDGLMLDSYDLILPEKKVVGSYATTLLELQTALELMATGAVDVLSWVDIFPLDRGVEAFQRMLAGQGTDIKAVILPS